MELMIVFRKLFSKVMAVSIQMDSLFFVFLKFFSMMKLLLLFQKVLFKCNFFSNFPFVGHPILICYFSHFYFPIFTISLYLHMPSPFLLTTLMTVSLFLNTFSLFSFDRHLLSLCISHQLPLSSSLSAFFT